MTTVAPTESAIRTLILSPLAAQALCAAKAASIAGLKAGPGARGSFFGVAVMTAAIEGTDVALATGPPPGTWAGQRCPGGAVA
jgi:hypothetical protein